MAGVNVLKAIQEAFNIPDSVTIVKGKNYDVPPPAAPARQPDFNIDQTASIDPELYRSVLGTPVYTNIQFLAGQYETATPGVFQSFGPMTLDAVLITVSQGKNIIKTQIQGRDGTVKEYIGMDDYQVTINGIITGPNGHYPIDATAQLKAILDAPTEIDVASAYLQNLGIHQLVVDGYEIGQKEGGYSYQTFSINCLSDVPQELRLANV